MSPYAYNKITVKFELKNRSIIYKTAVAIAIGSLCGSSADCLAESNQTAAASVEKNVVQKTSSSPSNGSRKIATSTSKEPVDSGNAAARMKKGIAAWHKSQYRNAINAFTSVIQADPKNAEAYAWRGLAYFEYDDLPKSRADLVVAHTMAPQNLRALMLASELQNYDAQYKAALASCNKILSLNPNARTYFLRSYANARLFNFAAAKTDLDLAASKGQTDLDWDRNRLHHFEWDHMHAEKDPAKRWTLACSAPMFEYNNQGIESLAGGEPTAKQKADELRTLDEWWGIKSKSELVQTINELLNKGMHHPKWMRAYREFKRNPAAFEGKEGDARIMLIKRYGDKFGEHGIQAFDLSRVVSLCRWGYMGGFLTEDEAFAMMLPAAVRLQKEYTNWDDFVTGYFVGRRFWNPFSYTDGSARVERTIQSLKRDPNILLRIPWNTKLVYDSTRQKP